MGKIMRLITLFLTVIIVLVVLYFAFYTIGVFKQAYSWQEMDWNQDGSTSIGEVFAATDIGKREITHDGKKCTEYYAYKDGLAVKTVCPK